VVKRAAPALAILLLSAAAWGEEKTDYQRYDLVRDAQELTLEAAFHYWTQEANSRDLHNFQFGVRAEYSFKTNHNLSFALPYTLAVYADPDARQQTLYSIGDISLGYDYLFQFNHINLFIGPAATIPLAETNDYALREGVFSAGGGRFTAGVRASVTGIRDPVVWNADIQYMIGLPKEERFYTSWQPGNMQVSAGFSNLVNSRFGFALGLTQRAELPGILGGRWDTAGVTVATTGKGEFFILFEKDYVRVSVETSLYPLSQPAVIGLAYGHKFGLSPKKPAKE
jgi:hypothetical protein